MRLENKVTFITGGASGIGRATAVRFAEEGATVLICDIDKERGWAAVKELGPGHGFFQVDVSDRKEVQICVENVVKKHGRIDILVNNAGILADSTLVKVKDGQLVKQMTEEAFDRVISINLKGVFNCSQAVAPFMIHQNGGVILNASSVVGLDGNFGQTNYVATKAGVIGMTRVWAREFGRYNIRVNAVAPGLIATEILSSMPDRVLDGMKAHIPLGRLGQPDEVANAYLFLASDEASFISGAVLRVDGAFVVGT